MVDSKLLKRLKDVARETLESNTRFHCYAHAIEVLKNVKALIKKCDVRGLDETSLFAVALFHDASNSQESDVEGKEGAEIAEKILNKIEDFPKDKIMNVKKLIMSINEKEQKTDDEIILNTADEMAVFSELGLIRSFMISGSKGLGVREAIEWQIAYLDKRFHKFKLEVAKKLIERQYLERKRFLLKCLDIYDE